MSASLLTPQLAVKLTVLVEAKRRVSKLYSDRGITFFGYYDEWRYEAVEDDKICPICRGHAFSNLILPGSAIRGIWSYLTILDVNMIGGPGLGGNGLCHPNCRCRLHRQFPEEPLPFKIFISPKAFKKERII